MRWWLGRGQAVIIAALVAVTSLATALVVVQGARQLGNVPRQNTTPYLAAEPTGPMRLPDSANTVDNASSPDAGAPRRPAWESQQDRRPATARTEQTRHRDTAEPAAPPSRELENAPVPPSRAPESGPAGPDWSEPPTGDEPPIPAGPPDRCLLASPTLAGCVVGEPESPLLILHPSERSHAGPAHSRTARSGMAHSGPAHHTPAYSEADGHLNRTAGAPDRAGPS